MFLRLITPNFAWCLALCVPLVLLLAIVGMPFQKFIIGGSGLEVRSGLFSRETIPSSDILGFATDYVRVGVGSQLVFSVVHKELGQQFSTRLPLNLDDLKEEKLRGLFLSMKNYGSVPLGKILINVDTQDRPPRIFTLIFGCVLLVFVLFVYYPWIKHLIK